MLGDRGEHGRHGGEHSADDDRHGGLGRLVGTAFVVSESIWSPGAVPIRTFMVATGVTRTPGTARSRARVLASIPRSPPGTTTAAARISCRCRASTAASPDFCKVSSVPTRPTATTIGATVAAVRRREVRMFSRTNSGPALAERRSGPISSRVTGRSRIGESRVTAPT
ncbi:hypothetical protein SAMN02787118_12969 [Streptomyces mirabilis]|uniref:Uncharacterized protein n=1 Tax=Streptomyces mirabilis TaxID=68239 RepID=A0A1I2UV21_9ACTN|nr:hypothetical protein SAMN02787118_12969 [Streptomyces mirabilis]